MLKQTLTQWRDQNLIPESVVKVTDFTFRLKYNLFEVRVSQAELMARASFNDFDVCVCARARVCKWRLRACVFSCILFYLFDIFKSLLGIVTDTSFFVPSGQTR